MEFWWHCFQQFDHSATTLAEPCQNKGTPWIAPPLELPKSSAHIAHSQSDILVHGIFILHGPHFDRHVAIIRRIKVIAFAHVGRNATDLLVHVGTVGFIIHVCVVTKDTIGCHPILLPRRNDVEYIRPVSCRVVFLHKPHRRIGIIGRRRDVLPRIDGSWQMLLTWSAQRMYGKETGTKKQSRHTQTALRK